MKVCRRRRILPILVVQSLNHFTWETWEHTYKMRISKRTNEQEEFKTHSGKKSIALTWILNLDYSIYEIMYIHVKMAKMFVFASHVFCNFCHSHNAWIELGMYVEQRKPCSVQGRERMREEINYIKSLSNLIKSLHFPYKLNVDDFVCVCEWVYVLDIR